MTAQNPPTRAVNKALFFPYGNFFFDVFNEKPAAFESLVAMRGAHGDDDSSLADFQFTDPMQNPYFINGPFLARLKSILTRFPFV